MPVQSEQLLLVVDISLNLERIAQLKGILLDNKKALDNLNKAFDAGTISQNELLAGQARLSVDTSRAQKEIATLTRAIGAQEAANRAAAGSTDELAAKAKLLALQVSALGTEQKKTAAGKELVAQLREVNAELIKQGLDLNDGRRNVGRYAESLKEAGVGVKDLRGGLQTATDTALKPFQGLLDRGTGLFTKFKSGSDLVKTGLASLQPAGETGALGFKAVAAGIALTGIGLFVLALTAVVSYFTQTNEGGKILKQGLAGLGAVVTTDVTLLTGAGKAGVEAFNNPKKAVQEFVGFLKEQVVNRLQAFGVLLDGIRNRDFKKIADSVIQFNLGITNGTDKLKNYAGGIASAAEAAANLEKQQQLLAKQRKQLEQDEILDKGRVEELIRLSKDRTVSAAERLNKLREAGKLEGELSAKSLKLTGDELALLQKRNEARGLSVKTDELQEARDKQKEYNQVLVDRNNILATIKARQSRFILEEAAELKAQQKAAAEAAQQRKEDAIRAKITEQEKLLLLTQEGSAAELAVKQKLVQFTADLEAAGAKKTAGERELIQSKAAVASQKLADEFADKMTEAERQRLEKAKTEQQREYTEAQQNLADYLAKKRAQVEQAFAEGRIGENEQQRQLNLIEKAGLQAELVNAMDYAKDYGAIQKRMADEEIKQRQRVKAEKKKIADIEHEIIDNGLQAGLTASDLLIKALGEETTAGKVALGIKKTLALAEIGINLEKQISNNAATGTEINTAFPLLAPELGVIYMVTADAVAIASAAEASAKVLGFNRGGIVPGGGPNVDNTTPVRLTNGEAVMTRAAVFQYGGLLGALNASVGGVNFAPGYTPPPRSFDGGLMERQIGQAVQGPTAAEIGRAVADNVPTEIGFRSWIKAGKKYYGPRQISSTGSRKGYDFPFQE